MHEQLQRGGGGGGLADSARWPRGPVGAAGAFSPRPEPAVAAAAATLHQAGEPALGGGGGEAGDVIGLIGCSGGRAGMWVTEEEQLLSKFLSGHGFALLSEPTRIRKVRSP